MGRLGSREGEMESLVFSETGVICSVRPAEGSLPKLMKSTNLISGARFFSHLQPHGRESVVAD